MGKVIVLTRYFDNSDAQLEMHYSKCLSSINGGASLRFKASKLGKARWNWNIKAECSYEEFIELFNKYALADFVKVADFIEDVDKIIGKNRGEAA